MNNFINFQVKVKCFLHDEMSQNNMIAQYTMTLQLVPGLAGQMELQFRTSCYPTDITQLEESEITVAITVILMSFFGPNSIFNINRGSGPVGYGVVHPVPPVFQRLYTVSPGYVLSNRNRGTFLNLINTSYEPFVAILALGGAILSFVLYQEILRRGKKRRKRYNEIEFDNFIGEFRFCVI